MNRSAIVSALASVLLLGSLPAAAQYNGWTEYRPTSTIFNAGYQMSQPVGGLKDYIGEASFRGFTFDWRSRLFKDVSAGLRFNWNRFNETFPNLTSTTATGGTLSGPVFRYMDQFAVQAIGHYYFSRGEESRFVPYLGVGIGGVWSNTYQQTADLGSSQDGFYFSVSPEIGMMLTLARGSTNASLNLGVSYNFTTASFRNVSNAQSLSETIALAFAY